MRFNLEDGNTDISREVEQRTGWIFTSSRFTGIPSATRCSRLALDLVQSNGLKIGGVVS